MQLSYTGTDNLSIKTKTSPITIGAGLKIGEYTVPGPGEYDIAEVQCEGKTLPSEGVAYFVRSEDLTIMYLPKLLPEASKLDDASTANILVLDIRSDDTSGAAKDLIKAIEPSYVFLLGAGATSEFNTELGIPVAEDSSLKISRTGLPLEGILLVARS